VVEQKPENGKPISVSRRDFLKTIGVAAGATILAGTTEFSAEARSPDVSEQTARFTEKTDREALLGEGLTDFLGKSLSRLSSENGGKDINQLVFEIIPQALKENIKKVSPDFDFSPRKGFEVKLHKAQDMENEYLSGQIPESVFGNYYFLNEAGWPIVTVPELVVDTGEESKIVYHVVSDNKDTLTVRDILPLALTVFPTTVKQREVDREKYFLDNIIITEGLGLDYKYVAVNGFSVLFTEDGRLPQAYFGMNSVLGLAVSEWVEKGVDGKNSVTVSNSNNIMVDLVERMAKDGDYTYSELINAAKEGDIDGLVRRIFEKYLPVAQIRRDVDSLKPAELGAAFLNFSGFVGDYVLLSSKFINEMRPYERLMGIKQRIYARFMRYCVDKDRLPKQNLAPEEIPGQ